MPFPPDPCAAVDAELAALGASWSQARDRLERWRWDNDCASKTAPSSTNWAKNFDPPPNAALPPDPDDRLPPQPGN